MDSKIVFVHAPKCAGSSLREGIVQAIGPEAVHMDYGNNPANPVSDYRLDPIGSDRRFAANAPAFETVRVAYGHLHPAKYRAIWPGARWMTVLRHPVDRLISHYYFWKDHDFPPHLIRDYVIRYDLSLVDFASLPFSQHYYRNIFTLDMDRSCFAFVGQSERLDVAAEAFGQALGVVVPVLTINTGRTRRSEAIGDEIAQARDTLTCLLADEIAFYEAWTEDGS